MKELSLEVPEYSMDMDPTKNQTYESIVEWNISKDDLKKVKLKYDSVLKDYKKRKAEEKLANQSVKMPKIKKCKDEEKISDIFKVKSDIIKENPKDNIDVTLDADTDDIFVE